MDMSTLGSQEHTSKARASFRAHDLLLRHALSVDVEDWYHDGGSSAVYPEERRVVNNTLRLMELLAEHDVRATFFVLGEVAERFPGLVRRVAAAGHEIGSHGFLHRPLQNVGREEFRQDVERSVRLLEDLTGGPVLGFRAPYLSIKVGEPWPLDVLYATGLRYDSSVLPIDHPPGFELVCPRGPFRHSNGLWEMPVAVLQVGIFHHLPLASGNGLRFVPPRILCRWIRRFERDVGPGVFYLHPWELDPDSPTRSGPGRWLLRLGRRRLAQRLASVLGRIAFGPIAEVFSNQLESVGAPRA